MSNRTRVWARAWTAAGWLAAVSGSARDGAAVPPGDGSGPLVVVHATVAHAWTNRVDTLNWSYPGYVVLRGAGAVFEELAAFRAHEMDLGEAASRRRVSVEFVTHTYFGVLGVEATRGRTFRPEEDAVPLAQPVALLGHEIWRRCFGGDLRIVGKTIELDGRAFTVVGVLPQGFRGLSGAAEIWVPLMMAPLAYPEDVWREPSTSWLGVVGRLRSGVMLDEAGDVVAELGSRVAETLATPGSITWCGSAALVPVEAARGKPRLRRAAWVR